MITFLGCWDLSGIIPNLSQNRPWEQHFFSPKEIEEKEFGSQELCSFHGEKFSLLEVSLLIEKNFKAPWPPNRGFGDGIGGFAKQFTPKSLSYEPYIGNSN